MPATTLRPLRLTLLALLALVAALLVLSPRPAAATEARAADDFVDSIGVNTHTYYTNTVYYQRFEEVKARLAELGVRHVREELMLDRSDQYRRLREMGAAGIGSTLVLGEPTIGAGGLDRLLAIAAGELGGSVEAIEGTNEYDLRGRPDWATELREYQERLYAGAKASPTLASLPVIGPSVVHWSNQDALGDISGALDYGNIHSYPDGWAPETNLGKHLNHATTLSASKPVFATETGYHSALDWSGSHKPADEATVATYLPRMFLEYFRRGVSRTFSYQLLDHWPNPGLDERELQFGLLRNDLSPKPAFLSLRNLIDILEDPGETASPTALDYELGGDRTDLHQVLLRKSDGRYYLALWRTSSIWDPVSRTRLTAPTAPVRVNVRAQLSAAAVYAPERSTAPIWSQNDPGDSLSVEVGAEARIVELSPGGVAEPPTPEPEPTPQPEPEPEPSPQPQPGPESSPGPEPQPVPRPAPTTGPSAPSASWPAQREAGRDRSSRRRAKHRRDARRAKLRRLRAEKRQRMKLRRSSLRHRRAA